MIKFVPLVRIRPPNARPATVLSRDGSARSRIAGSCFEATLPFAEPFLRLLRIWPPSAPKSPLTKNADRNQELREGQWAMGGYLLSFRYILIYNNGKV